MKGTLRLPQRMERNAAHAKIKEIVAELCKDIDWAERKNAPQTVARQKISAFVRRLDDDGLQEAAIECGLRFLLNARKHETQRRAAPAPAEPARVVVPEIAAAPAAEPKRWFQFWR